MGTISLSQPQIGQPDTTEDVKLINNFTTLQTWANGNVDQFNITASAAYLRLAPRAVSANVTANSGDLVIVNVTSAVTVTLPAPSAGATVGVVGNTATTVAGTNIFGIGLANPATSFSLALGVVQLVSDGSNWYIVAGQRDTGWVALSLATNWVTTPGAYTPSARLQADTVRLKGSVQNNTGGSSSAFGTVAAGLRPSVPIGVVAVTGATVVTAVQVAAGGAMTTGSNIPNGGTVLLDGITYTAS